MNSSTVADGFYEHLNDRSEKYAMTVDRTVNQSGLPVFILAFDGTKLARLTMLNAMVQLIRESPGPVCATMWASIKRYLGHQYEGGGLYFDLVEPDSLYWLDEAVMALRQDHLYYLALCKAGGLAFTSFCGVDSASPRTKTVLVFHS